jgi:CHAT domain-containing protein/Flp pilus assembly protein TadD
VSVVSDNVPGATELLIKATATYQSNDARRAFELLDEAIAKVPAADAADRASMLVQKAGWLRESGYPQRAAETLSVAARELDRLPTVGHETAWSSLRMEEGRAAEARGDFNAADSSLAEAEVLARNSPDCDLILPDVFANQASVFLSQGRFSDAQNTLLAALEIDQRVGNRRNESNDLNMLGLIYKNLGDLDTARAYLTKAFDVAYQSGLAREALHAMSNLAVYMDEVGDHAGAAALFEQIGSFQAEGGDESDAACSVANQGVSALLAGDPERAVALLTRSRQLHLAAGNFLHTAQDALNLSSVEAKLDHFDRALSYAEDALAISREHGLVRVLWAAEYSAAMYRARLAADPDQPQWSSAPKERYRAFEDALAGFRRAADVVELLRSQVDRPEERESLLAGKEGIYEEAIALSLAFGRAGDAFQFCERARMRSFLEAMGSTRLEQLEEGDPGASRRGELVTELLSPLTPAQDKQGLIDELRTLRAETMARRPALAVITEAELPTEDDIRSSIPAETCLLEYFELGSALMLFLLDRDGLQDCQAVRLDEPIESLIRQFRDEIESGNPELAAGNALFACLLRPVMPKLATTRHLIVAPHNTLHYVPFSALWYEPAGDDAPPRQYLKNRFYLSAVPSASYLPYLARITEPDRQYGPAVVLGNPTGDLPGAEAEARNAAARLGVTAKLGAQVTRRALLEADVPTVLHVACHGAYNTSDPLSSGLLLADGVVTVEDLLTSGPAPKLLVLSGCVTGMSERKPGDELVGLAQAALRAGTRAVVATLWETFDESSATFFENFYESLMEGGTVSEAVAWGREAVSTGPGGFDQPVDWAPFVLIGDPGQRVAEPDPTPESVFGRGVELLHHGDTEGAKTIFQQLASSPDSTVKAQAAFSLGLLLRDESDVGGALQAWRQASASGELYIAAMADYRMAQLLEDRGDFDGARAAYQRAADSGEPAAAPHAAMDLGVLLAERGDIEGARAAYQRAIESGHEEACPKAASNLGTLLAQQGDLDGALAAYQLAMNSGNNEVAVPVANVVAGMLEERDDVDGARAAYQQVIESGDEELAPWAALRLGSMLARHEDAEGASWALRIAVDSNRPDVVPHAAYNLGGVLLKEEDFDGAMTAFKIAAKTGSGDLARKANFAIGYVRSKRWGRRKKRN